MKKEVEEEEAKDVSVSMSVPSDAVTSNSGLTQSATGRAKYFEPQESCEVAASTNHEPVETGDSEEKMMPPVISSPDGLSCSPSTFHSSLPSASTSVIVPGTFTQKSSKEKVFTYTHTHNYIYIYTAILYFFIIGCEGSIQLL